MRSGTIAFLGGCIALHLAPRLPAVSTVAGLFALLLFVLARRPLQRLPAWFAAGVLWALLHAVWTLSHELPRTLEKADVVVTGRVVGLPEVQARRTRFNFEVATLRHRGESRPSPGRVRLSWYAPRPPVAAGERWRLTVRLKRPHGMQNPGGFDYEGWLFREGLRATGYVRDQGTNRRLAAAPAWSLDALRDRLRRALARAAGPGEASLRALAIGDRAGITDTDWQTLRRTGTAHLLAISGLHVGIVAGLGFLLVRALWGWLGPLPLRLAAPRAGAVAALLAAIGYAALAGFSLPTQRAAVMVGVAMAAVLAGRPLRAGRTLALALLAVLLFDPLAVGGAGLWLSFGAVALILYTMGGRLGRAGPGVDEPPGGRLARETVSRLGDGLWWRWGRVHLVVALGLAPLTLALFQEASLVAPLANLVAVPWTTVVVVPLTLLGTAALAVSDALAAALLWLAGGAAALLWGWLDILAAAPLAAWRLAVEAWTLVPAVLGAVWLLAPRGWPGRALGVIGLLPLLFSRPSVPPPGTFRLTVLDVGQGLAAVVQTRRHVLVYDAGPRYRSGFDTGRAVVVPYLRAAGVTRLDTVVVSHAGMDHRGGLGAVRAALPVGRLLAGDAERPPGSEPCMRGQGWRWDGVSFRILHPVVPRSGNDGSCVLRVAAGERSVLLTGDLEAPGERALLAAGMDRATVVVAPHHGSRTSSTPAFVAATAPAYAVFSTGYRNRYGFPAPTVAARYRAQGARLLDTAATGAVTFRLGTAVTVERYRDTARRYWWGR